MLSADRLGAPGIAVGVGESGVSRTSSRLDAGSVETSRTRLPRSARATAVAQASVVLPTPPLPVKSRIRLGSGSISSSFFRGSR